MNKNISTNKTSREQNQQEGMLTKVLEKQTTKIPSMVYLGLAVGAIALSAGLAMSEKRRGWANFVGLWVPSLLLLGVYNKIVKIEDSAREERSHMIH